ncbi:MAG: bifunctional glutamate N-acetyltransferase/amino-acid acetyltransferase ArgJ [Pseudomonadota bacterium]
MSLPVSPLAPAGGFPAIPPVAGVRLATAAAGVKYQGRDDVMLALMPAGTAVAGVFTRSATRSAPVLDCQEKLGQDSAAGAAFLVNAGNANAFTGGAGRASVDALTAGVEAATGVPAGRVFTASTGVIGERLPHGRIADHLTGLAAAAQEGGFEPAARAIMTTDTYAKGAVRTVDISGTPVTIAGFAKGSGMIAPDMATMLVYLFTDAAYDQAALQALLSAENERSFNCITVDSDTSTSDTLLMAATGAAGVDATGDAGFAAALSDLMRDLAHQVVRDGEGATKFVEVTVTGAADAADAKRAALAIGNSPLVKTALAGEDPNWGRIVMAVGKSGAAADRDRLAIWFGETLVAEQGWVADSYTEDAGAAYMRQAELAIRVDLGIGDGEATIWTCDLTHAYITINADYRS